MSMPNMDRGTAVPNVRRSPHTPSKNNTTTTSSSTSSTSTTVQNFQQMADDAMLRNRCELLRMQYQEVIGQDMSMATLKQLLRSLLAGTPWQYYEYALEEAALAPYPSWRYVMAIVSRLSAEAVPVARIRDPKPKRKGRVLPEQDYAQREYKNSDDILDRMMAEYLATQEGR